MVLFCGERKSVGSVGLDCWGGRSRILDFPPSPPTPATRPKEVPSMDTSSPLDDPVLRYPQTLHHSVLPASDLPKPNGTRPPPVGAHFPAEVAPLHNCTVPANLSHGAGLSYRAAVINCSHQPKSSELFTGTWNATQTTGYWGYSGYSAWTGGFWTCMNKKESIFKPT